MNQQQSINYERIPKPQFTLEETNQIQSRIIETLPDEKRVNWILKNSPDLRHFFDENPDSVILYRENPEAFFQLLEERLKISRTLH